MGTNQQDGTDVQRRAGVYARLSETYDAAESVPTQIERGTAHAQRRGDRLVATFKDDGFSAYKEITRDGFVDLIDAIERRELDVVIVRDVDRLTRNLEDWNRFEKACVRNGVVLSAYTGGDLDLSTPEGAYYGGMETLRAKRESAVKSARVREAMDRRARQGKRAGGGKRWFGYVRKYANPDEPDSRKRHILGEELHPVESEHLRDAVHRVLDLGEAVNSIVREWNERGIKPVQGKRWVPATLAKTLQSPHIAGLRAWQGKKYPADWPAIIDVDTHERLAKLFADPVRRQHLVRRQRRLLSGILRCGKCDARVYHRSDKNRARTYACVNIATTDGCGGVRINAAMVEEYVTGAVLDALESPRVQKSLREDVQYVDRRNALLAEIQAVEERRSEARRDYSEGVIDRADWLDIRQRTEQRIMACRREYDRLSGSETVLADIPPGARVREEWESWSIDRRRAAIRAVVHQIVVNPLPANMNPSAGSRDYASRQARLLKSIELRTDFDWR
jgi:site-specific DNA recombinase